MALFSAYAFAADVETLGREAEQAGKLREAFGHHMSAFQSTSEGSNDEQRLREKIIMLVQKLEPPPALPEKVYEYLGRAKSAFKLAKTKADYKQAALEFQKALRLAPWWANGYYNLGIAQYEAGEFDAAIKSFKLAATDAKEANKAWELIGEIQYQMEMAQKKGEEARKDAELHAEKERNKRQEDAARVQNLSGTWNFYSGNTISSKYTITQSADSIEILCVGWDTGQGWINKIGSMSYKATVNGLTINGTAIEDAWSQHCTTPLTGTISSDGKRIDLVWKGINPKYCSYLGHDNSISLERP